MYITYLISIIIGTVDFTIAPLHEIRLTVPVAAFEPTTHAETCFKGMKNRCTCHQMRLNARKCRSMRLAACVSFVMWLDVIQRHDQQHDIIAVRGFESYQSSKFCRRDRAIDWTHRGIDLSSKRMMRAQYLSIQIINLILIDCTMFIHRLV